VHKSSTRKLRTLSLLLLTVISSEEPSPRDNHLLATIVEPKRCADSLSNCQESLQEPFILFPTPRHLNRNLPSLRPSLLPTSLRPISRSRQINLFLPPRRVRSFFFLSSSPPPLSYRPNLSRYNLASAAGRIGFGIFADARLGSLNSLILCLGLVSISALAIWPFSTSGKSSFH